MSGSLVADFDIEVLEVTADEQPRVVLVVDGHAPITLCAGDKIRMQAPLLVKPEETP